ncbi:MAG: hypothetical protein WBX01_00530 [Nitrososphaeraceae archaeon]
MKAKSGRADIHVYVGSSLTNPPLLLDLPATPCTNHLGGKFKIGPDNKALKCREKGSKMAMPVYFLGVCLFG